MRRWPLRPGGNGERPSQPPTVPLLMTPKVAALLILKSDVQGLGGIGMLSWIIRASPRCSRDTIATTPGASGLDVFIKWCQPRSNTAR